MQRWQLDVTGTVILTDASELKRSRVSMIVLGLV